MGSVQVGRSGPAAGETSSWVWAAAAVAIVLIVVVALVMLSVGGVLTPPNQTSAPATLVPGVPAPSVRYP
jgi:bacteriorhodopsin